MLTPHDYQLEDVSRLRQELRRVRAVVYQLPTGAGKTIVAGYIASRLAENGKQALVLVHRRELVRQFAKTLTQAGLGDQYGIIAAGCAETRWARFQIASVQSINRRETHWLKPNLVIVDEAHHVKAKTWENVLNRFPSTRVLGLTATPGRLDGKPLGDHFDALVQGPSIVELVERGHLAPMRVLRPVQGLSTAGVRTIAGDWNKKDLDERLTDQVIAAGAAAYRRYGAGKRAIFFAVNRRHSKAVVESLKKEGFRAEHIDAETDVRRRDLVLKEFGEGLIQVVSNVDLISEGTDVPECEVIMAARPTKSVTMYLQQAGRAMRPGKGKTALLLDLAGNSWDLGLPEENRHWDLDGTRQGTTVDKRPAAQRQRCCSECAEVYPSRLSACPSCGAEHVLPAPVEVETELSDAAPSERRPKISRRAMKTRIAAVMRRREGYRGLVRIGEDFGFKPGWARTLAAVLKVPIENDSKAS